MPGIVGFTSGDWSPAETAGALPAMVRLLTHTDFCSQDPPYRDERLSASRVHIGIFQTDPQPYQQDDVCVWLDGEFNNRQELAGSLGVDTGAPDSALLLKAIGGSNRAGNLRRIDGIYSAVVYSKTQRLLHLVTDRYGLRHLCWTRHRGALAWSSESKGMLGLPFFEPQIDPRAVEAFFGQGHLIGNLTWFQGVELLPPATVLTYDLTRRRITTERYWSWADIQPLDGQVDRMALREELARRFIDAVERRCPPGQRVGLMLSGGLDSRAILAAMPDRAGPIQTLTFGKVNCDDIRFAKRAARKKGAEHTVVHLDSDGWLEPRVRGVWWADGELSLLHMHYLCAAPVARTLFDINLDGFLGDATIGGMYTTGWPDKPETSILDNRGRRFVILGTKVARALVEHRWPFYDNRFLELTLAVPHAERAGSHLYRDLLLRTFPEYYTRIPWQKTGLPISWPYTLERAYQPLRQARRRLRGGLSRLIGFTMTGRQDFADYDHWLALPPARSFVEELLLSPSALYRGYLSHETAVALWNRHLSRGFDADIVCRYLTFEIWLQQLFNGTYRSQNH